MKTLYPAKRIVLNGLLNNTVVLNGINPIFRFFSSFTARSDSIVIAEEVAHISVWRLREMGDLDGMTMSDIQDWTIDTFYYMEV